MKIYHFLPYLQRNAGTSAYVAELAAAQAQLGEAESVHIVTRQLANEIPVPAQVQVHYTHGTDFRTPARAACAEPNVVFHFHELWRLPLHFALRALRRHRASVVYSPHGMLEPGALVYSRWKKAIALRLFQVNDLQAVRALHATAPMEADNFRKLGLTPPIAISPPGVILPAADCLTPEAAFAQPKRTALFISRIHPKKNLPALLTAWAALRPADWELVIAGPDENQHLLALQQQVKALNLEHCVDFRGPVFGEEKAGLFRSASLFVLPSLSENFGIVVAEALSYGLPVIASTETPWRVLIDRNCGWWIPPSEEQIRVALANATSSSATELFAMGRRGRKLIETQFQWPRLASDMLKLYNWAMNPQSTEPDFVTRKTSPR